MQISRWGNSLAIRIPASVAEVLGLKEGDEVQIRAAGDGRMEVIPDDERARVIERIKALKKPLPPDWKFDRYDANDQ